MSTAQEKIDILVEEYGFDDETEMAEAYICDGIVPGICMESDCNATYDYEPDQDKGYCDMCGRNSVQSLFILMGII